MNAVSDKQQTGHCVVPHARSLHITPSATRVLRLSVRRCETIYRLSYDRISATENFNRNWKHFCWGLTDHGASWPLYRALEILLLTYLLARLLDCLHVDAFVRFSTIRLCRAVYRDRCIRHTSSSSQDQVSGTSTGFKLTAALFSRTSVTLLLLPCRSYNRKLKM